MIDLNLQVRAANHQDYQALSSLIFFETHAHRHLDWRLPLDWLGEPNFWVLEENRRIIAALACPPDPPGVAWIRLFIHSAAVSANEIWPAMWETARREIAARGGGTVAAIVRQDWFQNLISRSGFQHTQSIVMLEWQARPAVIPTLKNGQHLRPMTFADLPVVTQVDADAFGPFWHNSLDSLERAYAIAASAKVVEADGRVVAYQLSTGSAAGVHLARLAVRKEAQGMGLGRVLVTDLLQHARSRSIERLTVNTQNDNKASLSLYQKMGFVRTGEEYPVYRFDIKANSGG